VTAVRAAEVQDVRMVIDILAGTPTEAAPSPMAN
jgi:hypothetical protein